MLSVTVHTSGDAAFTALLSKLSPAGRMAILRRVGFLVARDAKTNARAMHNKARHPSKRGGGFWAKIAQSVSFEATEDQVTIGAAHEAAMQKEKGGKISAPGKGPGAKGARFLTIPINDKARGYSVGELAGKYEFFRVRDMICAMVDGHVEPFYLLRKSVFQKAQPWFPTQAQVFADINTVMMHLKLG